MKRRKVGRLVVVGSERMKNVQNVKQLQEVNLIQCSHFIDGEIEARQLDEELGLEPLSLISPFGVNATVTHHRPRALISSSMILWGQLMLSATVC